MHIILFQRVLLKRKESKMVNGDIRPVKKPDTDKVAQIVLDSLNKIAFDDDSQAVVLIVRKFYSEDPRVKLILGN
ncbi:hypothetical protein HMPREF1982_01217 [Clostridiales bacterium oral taxon 876 str. F0540]|nr:hypothetical protein HMPREF1982_01217 [Clostridiales bacterium oral taxon 876 str. F0540]